MCNRIFIASLFGFVSLVGVGQVTQAHANTSQAASLQPGELIQLKASIAGVEGGTSSFLVQKVRRDGQDTFLQAMIRARTNTFFDKIHKVNNIFTSWFSLFSDRSFQYRLDVDQAGLKQLRRLDFEGGSGKGTVTLAVRTYANTRGPVWKPWKRRYRVPTDTKNLVSALYHARFLPYQIGKNFSFHVFVLGKVWAVQGRVLNKTRLVTAIGSRRALELVAWTWALEYPGFKREVRIWLSDDAERIPLQITGHVPRIGTAKAELVSYRRNYHSQTLTANNHRKANRWEFLSDF